MTNGIDVMLGDVLAGLQLFDRFKKKYLNGNDEEQKITTIATRLVGLLLS